MWYNVIVKWMLRSPLHGFMSSSMMLLTFTGRKSGKEYTTPVSYIFVDHKTLLTISQPDRVWWRNLRGGAPVKLNIKAKKHTGHAAAEESPQAVTAGLLTLLKLNPRYAKYMKIDIDEYGQPDMAAVASKVAEMVVIRTILE